MLRPSWILQARKLKGLLCPSCLRLQKLTFSSSEWSCKLGAGTHHSERRLDMYILPCNDIINLASLKVWDFGFILVLASSVTQGSYYITLHWFPTMWTLVLVTWMLLIVVVSVQLQVNSCTVFFSFDAEFNSWLQNIFETRENKDSTKRVLKPYLCILYRLW